ncbi:Dabb family protein [Actinomadura sediminis]|uniref:Dabb family protein n=1 Tax=Actinomadura sediminis TaxID=1038904 RepID=A0ABW3ETK0_9ACTN
MRRWVILSPPETTVPGADGGPDLPGSVGGRGASWDLAAGAPPDVPGTEAVALSEIASAHVELTGPRVKRTLLLTVRPGTPPGVVAAFEADLMAMPRHIPAIRSWALSRTTGAWTHAWEQEFADESGLTGQYLLHPYHWTYVDRWFDAELPTAIVLPRIAHLYRAAPGPVLGAR